MSARSGAIRAVYLVFALIGLSCAAVSQLNLLTTHQEVEIGRQAAREVEREVKIYRDPVVSAYVDSLGQVLVRHSRRPGVKYSFKVVDTDQVNAFALPGGWLYINRGLITTAENEAELAGVIGHEIGHVVGKHGARQITKQYGLAVLVELAVGGENPSLARKIAGQFAAMGAGLTLLKYGRDAEREADYFAVEETYAAGINPEGMATFFEKLMAQQESKQESKQLWARGWFSTHPASRERIANVREQIAELPPKAGLKKDSKRFQEIKSRILKKDKTRSGETKLRETFRAF
jgi:predicted Zn-dependent protease